MKIQAVRNRWPPTKTAARWYVKNVLETTGCLKKEFVEGDTISMQGPLFVDINSLKFGGVDGIMFLFFLIVLGKSILKQKHEISSWQRDFMFLFGGKVFNAPQKTGTFDHFDPFEAGEDEFTWFDGELFLLVSCEAPLSPFSTWDPEKISTEQWQRMARGCLGFLVGDEQPTQFFGDYFINQFWRVPIFNNQYFMESSKDFVHYSTTSWFHLGDCDPGAVTPSHIEAYT